MNSNTPYIECYIPNSFLFQDESTDFTYGYVFGVKSQINQPLRFHVQLETGGVYWSVPIHMIMTQPLLPTIPLSDLQVWDCQSSSIQTTIFSFLANRQVDVRTPSKQWFKGKYLFSVDSTEGNYDDMMQGFAGHPDAKVYQIIELENGHLAALPNNHLRWHNPDFVKPYDIDNPPKYKSLKTTYSCEQRNLTADDEYFYKFEKHE